MLQIGPINIDFTTVLDIAARNPLAASWYLFIHGGWIPVAVAALLGFKWMWFLHIARKAAGKWKWVLLAIDVPSENIQSPRAVENIMAHLAGAHDKADLIQKYITGFAQPYFSLEIVSIGGFIRFYICTPAQFRDLVEASIYAQYPSAEISEAEDYTKGTPNYFPDPVYKLWGTEWKLVKDQAYPIRSYAEFQDETAEEAAFKDPMAALLETMSALREGEQLWFQILITCVASHSWQDKSYRLIEKLAGIPSEHKKTWLGTLLGIPGSIVSDFVKHGLSAGAEGAEKTHVKQELPSKMLYLTPGEREVIEAIERKAAKIGFHTKIRAVYLARQEVFNKGRGRPGIVGAIKQINTEDLNALKPDTKKIGTHAHYVFIERRKNWKAGKVIRAYKARSNWRGHIGYILNIEELATLWHFPVAESVKAPLMKKAESKRGAPPYEIPVHGSPHHRMRSQESEVRSQVAQETPDNLPVG